MASAARLIETIAADSEFLTALRRDIHAHPEIGFQERRTSDVIARTLSQWGIPVHRGIGQTGIVGVISNGTSQRAIGLRADMDALPMTEHNDFPHTSVHAGTMHACGHDGHVTMLLAAARYLSVHRNFDGTVYLIFQPAEERGGGAREMIRDGLFNRFPMQAIFGAHNWPDLPVGQFAVSPGAALASSNEFTVTVRGKGTHAALPHAGIDTVLVACQMVQAFQTIITRNKRPIDTGVISITSIRAGEAINVIPDRCELQGTVRTFGSEVLDLIEQRMREVADGTCRTFGASCEFQFLRKYPPTINCAAEADFVRRTLAELVGERNVHPFEGTMGAEDFSFYLAEKPGCYFFVGQGYGALHAPSYDFNDELIPIGGAVWVHLAETWLASTR